MVRIFAPLVVVSALLVSGHAHAAGPLPAGDRIRLQTLMHEAVDQRTIDGKFRYFDRKAGDLRELFPAKGHPMILSMDDGYVLCSSFRNSEGQDVNIDFYLVRRGDGFAVVDTVVDNRGPLEALMKAGRVKPVE